ncbi:hypothetical protein ABTY61_00910 [Kitasatospora sp. NPDC096128]|uniref:hypothetical protein n=1 Tax=Kitasatospora sp. NPDC096128 TaxID=3155547 RepID=UPI00331E231A
MGVLAGVLPAALLVGVALAYGVGRRRHRVVHELPAPSRDWHDVGPEAVELRRRARRWRLLFLARRVLVIGGGYLAFSGWVSRQALTVSSAGAGGDRLVVAAALLALVGLALTPLCRRYAHPMYSPPRRGRAGRRHSLRGSLVRTGVAAVLSPALLYGVPMGMLLVVLTAMAVTGQFGALGGVVAVCGTAAGLLALRGLASVVRWVDQRGLRYRSPRVNALLAADQRPHVLYLRTFQDDAVEIRAGAVNRRGLVTALSPGRRLPFEEVIAWRFQHYGAVIAGNDPNAAGLATLGAAKLFLSTEPLDRWKYEVEMYARSSRAVLLSAAPVELRPGFRYELEMLGERMPPHPLLLLVPPDRPWTLWRQVAVSARRAVRVVLPKAAPHREPPTVAQRWAAFGEFVERWPVYRGARELNSTGAAHLLLYVPGEGWSAWGAERRTEWTYAVAIMRAMEHLEARCTLPVPPRGFPQPAPSGPPPQPSPYGPPPPPPAPPPWQSAPPPPWQSAPPPPPPPWRPAPAPVPRGQMPATVRWALGLTVAAMVCYLPATVVLAHLVNTAPATEPTVPNDGSTPAADSFGGVLAVELVISFLVWIPVAWRCARGDARARSAATVLFGIVLLCSLMVAGRMAGVAQHVLGLGFLLPALVSVVLLWRPGSAPHFEPRSPARPVPPGAVPGAAVPLPDLGGPERHQATWRELPLTVRAALLLMSAGTLPFTAAGYTVEYRLLHALQAPMPWPQTLDDQVTRTGHAVDALLVVLAGGAALALWAWIVVRCRHGRPSGRVAATVGAGLVTSLALPQVLLSFHDPTLWTCCVLLVPAAAGVLLLWHPRSAARFAPPGDRSRRPV